MGHANLSNISDLFVRRLYAKGKLSIREAVDALEKAGETLQASEGEYTDRPMLGMGTGYVVGFLAGKPSFLAGASGADFSEFPVIVPVGLTPEQEELYRQWYNDDDSIEEWDCGDDGDGGQYGIFDSIRWKFAPGWRKRYPNIPRLGNISN